MIDEIEKIYDRIGENPYQFPLCDDAYLVEKGYREAVVLGMDYLIIFRIANKTVDILGIFHQLENYQDKLS